MKKQLNVNVKKQLNVAQVIKDALPVTSKGHWWEIVQVGAGHVIRLCWRDLEQRKRRKSYPRVSKALAELWLSETPENRSKHVCQWVTGHTPDLALQLGWAAHS